MEGTEVQDWKLLPVCISGWECLGSEATGRRHISPSVGHCASDLLDVVGVGLLVGRFACACMLAGFSLFG